MALLSTDEAARVAGVQRNTIFRWEKCGLLVNHGANHLSAKYDEEQIRRVVALKRYSRYVVGDRVIPFWFFEMVDLAIEQFEQGEVTERETVADIVQSVHLMRGLLTREQA